MASNTGCVGRRCADRLQHVGRGGLSLQRLARLVEQPCTFSMAITPGRRTTQLATFGAGTRARPVARGSPAGRCRGRRQQRRVQRSTARPVPGPSCCRAAARIADQSGRCSGPPHDGARWEAWPRVHRQVARSPVVHRPPAWRPNTGGKWFRGRRCSRPSRSSVQPPHGAASRRWRRTPA